MPVSFQPANCLYTGKASGQGVHLRCVLVGPGVVQFQGNTTETND